ncbi:MAG: carboxy terminal-processing peptidase [Cryomorphaceae bacterium]|nr:carboxy terminal-processing peptidase [Cryomorphaceae bacterium]
MQKVLFYLKYPVLLAGIVSLAFTLQSDRDLSISDKQLKKENIISEIIYKTLITNHFSPPTINSEFAAEVFDEYFESTDYNKRILLQSDIDQLRSKYGDNLEEFIKNADLRLFNESYDIIMMRLDELPYIYEEILDKPFDYSKKEFYQTDDEKRIWPKDKKERKEHWRKFLKYKVLTRVYEAERRQNDALEREAKGESSTDEPVEVKDFAKLESEARTKELSFQKEWLNNYKELDRIDWFAIYINSIANNFDPHTEYYPPQQREEFEVEMSGQFEGIGAQLMTKGDYITIDKIVTGSASWRQGDLEVGDKILAVAEEGETPIDVVGMSIQKAVKLIRGKKGTTVILTVLKLDGSRQDIPIVRDVVEIEATFARGAVIEQEGKKMGYIRLPKFYVDFTPNKKDARNCADDVKAEIEMLKNEGVEGIILDLRSNGGGTLEGVVDIAGFFIEAGPIVQVQASGFKPKVLRDRDKNIEFDGPLVVMTNSFSASASEIFAAAIQDHKRGIILGSHSTFGKGTVQNMADLDRFVAFGYNEHKPLGALKLTIQKFYRINGGTPQLRGVQSDIVMPDQFHYMDFGEKDRKNAMAYSEIEPTKYTPWNRDDKVFNNLVKESQKRINKNDEFKRIDQYAKWLSEQRDDTEVNLQYQAYAKKQEEYREKSSSFKDIFKTENPLNAFMPKQRREMLNEQDIEDWEKWLKNVGEDLQITEAFRVLSH